MRIYSGSALDEFRGAGRCEMCGVWSRNRQAHHAVVTRGAGGSDVWFNLIALGGHMSCACHDKCHRTGQASWALCVRIIAEREGVSPEWVIDENNRLRNLPKGADYTVPGRGYEGEVEGVGPLDRAGRGDDAVPGDEPAPGPGCRPVGVPADEDGWVDVVERKL